jgi:hypothetical protein
LKKCIKFNSFADDEKKLISEEQIDSGVEETPEGSVGSLESLNCETVVGDNDSQDDSVLDNLSLMDIDGSFQITIVTEDNRESTDLTVDKSATIADVISRSTINPNDFDLVFDNGRTIPRNETLLNAGIITGSKLRLRERRVPIFVRDNGKNYTCNVRPSGNVADLKAEYFKQCQVPNHQQRLLFQGIELRDENSSLRSYNIKSESHVEMAHRLRGGSA